MACYWVYIDTDTGGGEEDRLVLVEPYAVEEKGQTTAQKLPTVALPRNERT